MFAGLIQRSLLRAPVAPAAVSSWTPASLPALKAWYEAGASTTFTDAGVTNVTADGQAVAQWNDKSGNGQNMADYGGSTTRPLWNSGAGKPYLAFDGTNDTLVANLTAPVDGSGQVYVAVSGYFNSVAVDSVIASLLIGADGFVSIYSFGGNSLAQVAGTGTVNNEGGPALTSATPCVLIATMTTSAAEMFLDNATNGSTALSASRTTGGGVFYAGSIDGGSQFFAGRIYGAVVGAGVLSSGDRASLQSYMAGLHP